MNKEVNFEIAKLLKEKGFDVKTTGSYVDTTPFSENENDFVEYFFEQNHNEKEHRVSAPTIAEVVMWLYEKHRIWIDVCLTDNSRHCYFDYAITTSNDRDYNDEDCFDRAKRIYNKDKHGSPTKAYSSAIEYTLKNLI